MAMTAWIAVLEMSFANQKREVNSGGKVVRVEWRDTEVKL